MRYFFGILLIFLSFCQVENFVSSQLFSNLFGSKKSEFGDAAKLDKNTKLVLFGTRHGNRNPGKYITDDRKWGLEGPNELTSYGKKQGYGLGLAVRKFIGKLANVNYLPKECQTFSSSANRCQMTLQMAMAGVYRPHTFARWGNVNWSPVPYKINDPMLRMYSVDCPTSDNAWKPISEDTLPSLKELTQEKKQLIDYVSKHTGWEPTISNMADVADNLIQIKIYKGKYPDWMEKPTLDGYDKEKLIEEILEFAENHQIKCAEHEPCRNVMGGVWVTHIIDTLRRKADDDGEYEDLKLVAYASVRLLFHDPDSRNPLRHHIYVGDYRKELEEICDEEKWCPLDQFIDLVDDTAIGDWKAECKLPTCDK